tara:strand:+ start:235 stop:354 length:120 start_codon:yes stop_codon:yes gene_type:complete
MLEEITVHGFIKTIKHLTDNFTKLAGGIYILSDYFNKIK